MFQKQKNAPHEHTESSVDTVEALFREGRRMQLEEGIPPLKLRSSSLWPWAVLAGFLVVLSLAIELFWPLPHRSGPLPMCKAGGAAMVSCQKREETSQEGGSHRMAQTSNVVMKLSAEGQHGGEQ